MNADLCAEDVRAYLMAHPDFFELHPNVLESLTIPHHVSGTHSLVERQVAQLRKKNEQLRHRVSQLLATARTNNQLLEKTQKLSLLLNETLDFSAQISTLKTVFEKDFNAECYSLLLFDQANSLQHDYILTPSLGDVQKKVPGLMNIQHVFCGQLRESEYQFLFPHYEKTLGSVIIIPIDKDNLQGLIALGSRDKKRFHHQLGTLFAEYIGNMVGNSLANTLELRTQ